MSEKAELVIDTEEVENDDDNVLFLNPKHIRGVKFCALNTFDYVTIKHCPTEKLNSGALIGIFNSLKPGAEVYIEVNQPISVMLEYDSKQIEANLRLVGFENIEYSEKTDKVNGVGLTVGSLTAKKPLTKQNNIQIEITKSEKNYTYQGKNDNRRERERERERENERDDRDRGGYRVQKKTERVIETKEEAPSRFNRGKYTYNKTEKNEEDNISRKKYNRFSQKEEDPKNNVVYEERVERVERPKRYGYSRVEEKPNQTTTTEVVIEKRTYVDKNSDLENKKAGLRRRYGKH